ncbi:ABC transporter ATP-binding protein [Sediminivirga luteola]|uniref:ABC transporter ATP-binding protein n=1 Tax=Sediminivirga luteola TaxID=1774748 RepID=A0A8J2U049_9MICO|nr:ABC transporter ATP-binding protein [Sediminivirga luteola]GGA23869.1 ABC transporter ATP-binding protein [Sediminivirga luteola]
MNMISTDRNAAPVIEVREVSRGFPDGDGGWITAVDRVTLGFQSGEVTALLGPNGAGKTTLIDMLLGLSAPESGTIVVAGTAPRTAVREGRIGALLQTGGLLPDLTVKETVRMIAALYRDHAPVEEVMETAGLTDFAARRVGKCSGGQQQRLKFALALLPRPAIIVLDEPTTGMDVTARHEFWERMRAQAETGTTVIFATHYLEEAEQFARRTVLMHRGRVIADGPTAEVQRKAGAANVTVTWSPTEDDLAALPRIASAERRGGQITFRTEDADALARHLLTATTAHSIAVRPASLEEAFMLLTDGVRADGQDGADGVAAPVAPAERPATTEGASR